MVSTALGSHSFVMLWCCGTLKQTQHSVKYAAFDCRGHRIQLGNCVPRLPRGKSEVGASLLSKFTISLVSSINLGQFFADSVMFSFAKYKELIVYF